MSRSLKRKSAAPLGSTNDQSVKVLEEDIRRIHYSRLFLGPSAAAQRDISGADDGVATDVPVGLYQDYRRVVLHVCNGGGQPGSSGPDRHDVRFSIPLAHS